MQSNQYMEAAGYIASVFIGLALGLIGGGGSILTVPVLVYLFGVQAVPATAYSLFIVGATSLLGAVSYFKKGLVSVRTAVVFGLPSVAAVFLTRAYLVPAIPEKLFTAGSFELTKDVFLMSLFALLMIAASYSMIRDQKDKEWASDTRQFNYPAILAEGSAVGGLTGLVGAGGGFLIIPALVILSGLPMKKAVGTSLVIIAAKSLLGFLGEDSATDMNWYLMLTVTFFAVLGIFAGTALSGKIDGKKLKPIFGWFVLVMGVYILANELFF